MKSLSPNSNFYSEKSAVEKYLSPLSGSNATIVFPLFSSFRASSTATLKAAPEDIPTKSPSLFKSSNKFKQNANMIEIGSVSVNYYCLI